MAIKSNSNKIAYGVKRYVLDVENDLNKISLSTTYPGSTAFIIDTSTTYMLNNAYQWKKIKSSSNSNSGSNSGSGSGSDDVIWDGGEVEDPSDDNIWDGGDIV